MLTIGVDVGISGAMAVIDQHGTLVALEDLPIFVHGKLKWIDGLELNAMVRRARDGIPHVNMPARAFVELTHAMPKLGTVAASSKGLTLGSTLAALQIAGIPLELVRPQAWKGAMGLLMPKATDAEKKAASMSKARMLFPSADLHRVKDHNRAEALLIAAYAQRFLQARAQAA